jgi:hypothetical protein
MLTYAGANSKANARVAANEDMDSLFGTALVAPATGSPQAVAAVTAVEAVTSAVNGLAIADVKAGKIHELGGLLEKRLC